MTSMRRLSCLLLLAGAAHCGHDSTPDGATTPPDDSGRTDAPGCPMPVECVNRNDCDLPPPVPRECIVPYIDFYRWIECSNGYVIITRAAENSGSVAYYRDGKLVAVFGGHLVVTCLNGPADFVRPDCMAVQNIDLCAKDASAPGE
jgi:hypothetical protein